ncbi:MULTISPECIES: hypothetical protein [Streptomyces violaceusniger group]|nr:hypothetical protein [Streptomyces indonesiensis]
MGRPGRRRRRPVGDPWGFRQWNADDPEGEDVRHASVGQLSLTY